jgi:hypothetical protein
MAALSAVIVTVVRLPTGRWIASGLFITYAAMIAGIILLMT